MQACFHVSAVPHDTRSAKRSLLNTAMQSPAFADKADAPVRAQGMCKSFDAQANGYARSDGVAAVILRREDLPHATAVPAWSPRPPYARVLACATNNDGHTKEGVTFPSGPAQRALAQEVCARAGIGPGQVTYVEAHGTGTVRRASGCASSPCNCMTTLSLMPHMRDGIRPDSPQ